MTINDFLRRHQGEPNPDGGIGGLTPREEVELSDLLNAGRCECGVCECNSPLIDPNRKRPGA